MSRILIDGRMAINGGGYTYLVNIVPRIAALRPWDLFRVIVRTERTERALAGIPNVEVLRHHDHGAVRRVRFTLWDAPRIAREWDADLFFSVSEYAPATAPCPTVASFRNPNVFTALRQGWPLAARVRLRILRSLARLSALRCERIMFVSEDSARWIGERMRLARERRAVVHHGIETETFANARQAPRPHPRPYILSVSSIYRYKNYVRLIEAYAELARKCSVPDLVLIGDDQDPEYAAEMERARLRTGALARNIHILGEVSYEAVKAYYAHAELFVFPSYLETFGHPILEAMASDTPLVAADIPVFREIAGDAAFYADPHSPTDLAEAMRTALLNPEARRHLVKQGRERLQQFSWDHTATRLMALFDGLLGEASAPASQPVERAA